MGRFSFQMTMQFTAVPYLEIFFWGDTESLLHVRCKTTHHT